MVSDHISHPAPGAHYECAETFTLSASQVHSLLEKEITEHRRELVSGLNV